MKLYLLVSFLVVFSLKFSGAYPAENTCQSILLEGGLSSRYNETIGHVIHAMSVEGLQLFNPLVNQINGVPTVNKNLSDKKKLVLPNAPSNTWMNDFGTKSMNIIDTIMSSIGISDKGLNPHSPMEKIVHVFHMWDLWTTIKIKAYPEVLMNPPNTDVCDCLKHTRDNGIYAVVTNYATHPSNLFRSGTNLFRAGISNRSIPKLTDASSWGVWKERLLYYYKDQDLKDAAIFLYCVTHE